MRRTRSALLLAVAVCAFSARASAQASLAETLYREGRALMTERRYAEACAKFAESQRLDPGTGTLLNLATCHEKEGKIATAWAEFNEAKIQSERDKRADRTEFAEDHMRALEPRLSRLSVVVPPAARVPGLDVTLDGVSLGPAAWGVAAPIDPGTHVVAARAEGRRPFSSTVEIGLEAAARVVEIPVLAEEPSAPAPVVAPIADPAPSPPVPQSSDGKTQRVVALAVGGLGLAGVVTGSVFGLSAKSSWDDRNAACGPSGCSEEGVAAGEDAQASARVANVAFAVGAVALGAAAVLFITAPKARASPSASSLPVVGRGGGLSVRF